MHTLLQSVSVPWISSYTMVNMYCVSIICNLHFCIYSSWHINIFHHQAVEVNAKWIEKKEEESGICFLTIKGKALPFKKLKSLCRCLLFSQLVADWGISKTFKLSTTLSYLMKKRSFSLECWVSCQTLVSIVLGRWGWKDQSIWVVVPLVPPVSVIVRTCCLKVLGWFPQPGNRDYPSLLSSQIQEMVLTRFFSSSIAGRCGLGWVRRIGLLHCPYIGSLS